MLNPNRLVMSGGPDQLSAFALSKEAIDAWRLSPISYVMMHLPASAFVMLTTEYRSCESLYSPTSVTHYHGKVHAAPSTTDRLEDVALLAKLAQIEVDVRGDGDWRRLDSCFLLFDVPHGEMRSAQIAP